jgi:hypothetical protein
VRLPKPVTGSKREICRRHRLSANERLVVLQTAFQLSSFVWWSAIDSHCRYLAFGCSFETIFMMTGCLTGFFNVQIFFLKNYHKIMQEVRFL